MEGKREAVTVILAISISYRWEAGQWDMPRSGNNRGQVEKVGCINGSFVNSGLTKRR